MRIGVIIGRIGGVDGVALETEKWITVLERMGHEVAVLTGQRQGEVANTSVLPPLSFDHPACVRAQEFAFFRGGGDEAEMLASLEADSEQIAGDMLRWIDTEGIESLLVENASALPCHLQMGMAVRRVCEDSGLPTVTHDHDFAWERHERYVTPNEAVRRIVDACFPLIRPNVRHAVINSAARQTLRDRYATGSLVVPNVMDFGVPFAEHDEYNATLRRDLRLEPEDVLLFQITRIVRRKGIETAIQLVDRLADPRVKLVITGTSHDDTEGSYEAELRALAAELAVRDQVLFAGDRFDNQRRETADGRKVYSLADGYANANACTYFSTYEGFGNAFVEAVVARRPIFVNRYEPVYWPDIGSLGFDTVMIEGGQLSDRAVADIRAVLGDPERQAAMADTNYALGERHFSYDALEALLGELFVLPARAGPRSARRR